MTKKQQEIYNGFQKLRVEQQMISRNISELEINHTEHIRVIATLKKVEPERKCFRLIDEVLVEKTVAEILPVLESEESKMLPKLEELKKHLEDKGRELLTYKKEHNIKFANESQTNIEGEESKLPGDVQRMTVK